MSPSPWPTAWTCPAPPAGDDFEEADIEGLDYAEGCLWLTGSHSLKRKNPKPGDKPEKARKDLAKLSRDGNRYLLARVPLVEEAGQLRPVRRAGDAHAARLDGDAEGNTLTQALADDPPSRPFHRPPRQGQRLRHRRPDSGRRAPVPGPAGSGAAGLGRHPGTGPRGPPRRIASPSTPWMERVPTSSTSSTWTAWACGISAVGATTLLILAGPTMDLDGPVRVYRWPGGARPHRDGAWVPAETLEAVLDIPYGRGDDHAEGMTLFTAQGNGRPALAGGL
jgi:hypothetical protein